MTVGQSTTHAHAILNVLRGTSYTGITPYLKLYLGDPGASGTANASTETTRKALTFAAPSAGSSAASAVSWAWSASNETISHVGIFDASTAGNFLASAALSVSKAVASGDTLNVTITATQGPLAA